MLRELLNIKDDETSLISFVGAGGKTTAMLTLSKELHQLRRLVTTTTAFFAPDTAHWNELVVGPELQYLTDNKEKPGRVVVWGESLGPDHKLKGVPLTSLKQAYESGWFDVVLVEADGSKHKPIKAPMDHEPVIPKDSTMVIGVVGLSALIKPVNDQWIHRLEQFMAITGAKLDEPISPEHVAELVMSPHGLFKGTPVQAQRVLLLNQADTMENIDLGKRVIRLLKGRRTSVGAFLLTSFDTRACQLVWGERQ